VLAYSVNQRTHEIGVRMAFGALGGEILWMILRRALALVGIGLVVGLGLPLLLPPVIQSLLFGIDATDPTVFALVSTGILILGFLACWLPTRRTLRIEPVSALRYE
jgi:putative ABC transport system permease protein